MLIFLIFHFLRFLPICGSMFKTHQYSTCHHICLQGIVLNISIETSARNQTAFFFESLIGNAALLLWATDGEHLLNENNLKDLVFT